MAGSHETIEDETMRQMAQDLLMALLDSIPPGQIDPKKYWDWAQKALIVGSRRATNPHELVEEMRRILQIPGALRKSADSSISSVVSDLVTRGWWPRFRLLVKQEAGMIVVLTRVRRDQRRARPALHEDNFLSLDIGSSDDD